MMSCKLSIIKIKPFCGLSNLKYLDLQYNGLSKLDTRLFEKLSSLDNINLSGNPITNIEEIKEKTKNVFFRN